MPEDTEVIEQNLGFTTDELIGDEVDLEPASLATEEPAVTVPAVETPAPAAEPVVTAPEPVVPPAPVVPATPVEPVAAVAPAAPVTPAVQAPVVPAAAPVATSPAAQSKVPTREEVIAARNSMLSDIEKGIVISQEDEETLGGPDASRALRKLAAQNYLGVYEAVYNTLMNQLPHILKQHNDAARSEQESVQQFFSRWPALNKPEYSETINRSVGAYRHANPQADRKTVIEEAGALAMMTLRIPVTAAVTPVAPAPAPHVPVAPGAAAGGIPARDVNPFEVLAREFEELESRE